MTTKFDPSKLNVRSGGQQRQRGPRAERLFVVVDDYEMPDSGFHYAVGRCAASDRPVRVRLNTVAERMQDRPKLSEDAVKAQYVTSENPRETIADKAKAGIKLIAFDDCRAIESDGEVTEFRAHWPKTISTSPDAEIFKGKAHIRLRDAVEHSGGRAKAQAYVELVKSCEIATTDNIDLLLKESLTISDGQGRRRDPLMIMRVMHEGRVVGSPRLYPLRTPQTKFDQALGEKRTIALPVDWQETVAGLMMAEPGRSDFENASLDAVRAIVAALKGQDEPRFNSEDDNAITRARNLYWGVKEGALHVEVISAEKIDFGADTRKTYLKDKNLPHLAAYVIKEPRDESSYREAAGFTDTVIGVHRHDDGEPYAVYASPQAMWPKVYRLQDLYIEGSELGAEFAPEAEQAPEPTPSVAQEAEPVVQPGVVADLDDETISPSF